jgi:hypothetical protein
MQIPPRDPIASFQRKTTAARRVGTNAKCTYCGERRPEALIADTTPLRCSACEALRLGKSTFEKHHPAGRSNSAIAIAIPVNHHRAELSVAQHDWPPTTLRNPKRNSLIALSARIRGYIDTLEFLTRELLHGIPEQLESLPPESLRQFDDQVSTTNRRQSPRKEKHRDKS